MGDALQPCRAQPCSGASVTESVWSIFQD